MTHFTTFTVAFALGLPALGFVAATTISQPSRFEMAQRVQANSFGANFDYADAMAEGPDSFMASADCSQNWKGVDGLLADASAMTSGQGSMEREVSTSNFRCSWGCVDTPWGCVCIEDVVG